MISEKVKMLCAGLMEDTPGMSAEVICLSVLGGGLRNLRREVRSKCSESWGRCQF